MGSGDLLRECEPDTAAFRLSGVEGHEEILGVGNTEAAVFDANDEIRLGDTPADAHRLRSVGQRCVDGVGEQVDEHLFELIGIRVEHNRRARIKPDRYTLLKQSNPFEQGSGLAPA